MKMLGSIVNTRRAKRTAFTMIELLVVIAIIAILAAILFPVFASARENARQSNTMSKMQNVYVNSKLYFEDEGRFPTTLLGYAEVPVQATLPAPQARPALPGDTNITPINEVTGRFSTNPSGSFSSINRGFLFREYVKDHRVFLNDNNFVKNPTAVTIAYWPLNSPISKTMGGSPTNRIPVTWTASDASANPKVFGDTDLPGQNYIGQPKLFYVMDSMTIGPMLNERGQPIDETGNVVSTANMRYELHYTPDWSHRLGAAEDFDPMDATLQPLVTQLKYKNPPSERTVITYVTAHAALGNPQVLVLLLSGTVRKVDPKVAYQQLPLGYKP